MTARSTVKQGNVEILHHRTSSTVELKFGKPEAAYEVTEQSIEYDIWLDYSTFENLKEAIEKTNFP